MTEDQQRATGAAPLAVRRMGTTGLLVELPDLAGMLGWYTSAQRQVAAGTAIWADVVELVPAARTVLLRTRHAASVAALAGAALALPGDVTSLPRTDPDPAAVCPATLIEIPVAYDGPDLAAVAELTGLTQHEVIQAHCGTPWRVAFTGFAPGFGYLTGGDPRLQVPRRPDPRPRVPAGSVGLAGEFTGVYPRPSPGGWQLIGSTELVLFDVDRDPPALLVPGTVVRFVDRGRR